MGKGPVHQVQGINNPPYNSKFQATSKHHEIYQHGVNTCNTVTYVYKCYEGIWFHQRRYINYRVGK